MDWIAIVVLAVVVVSFVYGLWYFRKTVEVAETVIDDEKPSEGSPDVGIEAEMAPNKKSRPTV